MIQEELILAIKEGSLEQVKTLIHEENKNSCDKYGNTPLMISIQKNQEAIFDFILAQKVEVNHFNLYGANALILSLNKNLYFTEKLLAHQALTDTIEMTCLPKQYKELFLKYK